MRRSCIPAIHHRKSAHGWTNWPHLPESSGFTPDLSNSPDRRRKSETPLNELYVVAYRGGWIGMLAGENQVSALRKATVEINGSGFRVVAAVEDRWNIWKHLGVALLYVVTLGFVGKVQRVILITEQMR